MAERGHIEVLLPRDEAPWAEAEIAAFVGERFYCDVGSITFAGRVAFAAPEGTEEEMELRRCHVVRLRVEDFSYAFSASPLASASDSTAKRFPGGRLDPGAHG